MRFLPRIMLGFLILPALGIWSYGQADFALRNGDCVVFYGDSITDQRLYTTFIESYVVTRFPRLNVRFIHSGWSGDSVGGSRKGGTADLRLRRDVIAYKATVMTIMLGFNDGQRQVRLQSPHPFDHDQERYNIYTKGYENIVKAVKGALPGIRITVIEPSPYDEVTRPAEGPGGYNSVLIRYGRFLRELARRENLTVVDVNSPVVAMLEKANAIDPKTAQQIFPDRIHPGPAGHLIMAEALLKAWNAPAQVTSVEIDTAGKRVVRAENTAVTALSGDRTVSWMQTDKALPLPLDWRDNGALALAVQSSDVLEALDQQPLKVTGLEADRYALRIDGEDVGVFTRPQLERGLNLAVLPTPMSKQALRVHELTLRHNDVHFARWRELQVPFAGQQFRHLQPAMDTLDKLEAEIIAKQRVTARPISRNYELIPVDN